MSGNTEGVGLKPDPLLLRAKVVERLPSADGVDVLQPVLSETLCQTRLVTPMMLLAVPESDL
jgi:hypothetical protein